MIGEIVMVLGNGTIVLNQDFDNPMSGEIIDSAGNDYLVRWSNGLESWEEPADLTLTAKIVLR